ncbi:MAG: AMP-binding protein [Rhodocyclaceae bacterium]|nr:AMP-binding protein [Rhodocyclaceae bacterium]
MEPRIVPDRNADRDYCPTLSPSGQAMLDFLREHPAAPIYRNQSGNRLLADEVAQLRDFEREVLCSTVGWPKEGQPHWLGEFVARTYAEVPHFRAMGTPPTRFEDIPTLTRADLAADIAPFVPDTADVERLINFRTTGTTGTPLLIASHPRVAGSYLAFHKRALRRFGVEPRHGRGQVGVVLLGMQRKCFTYVSVTPVMDESGLAKINLHPDDWRDPLDRVRYLEALQAEIISGDPISFAELLNLPVKLRPRALMSVGMMLSTGLRQRLEARFACPVLDLYSLNEVGPVAVFDPSLNGHLLLQPRLYVEILDTEGQPVNAGERGEITFTGGFNFCLPLLRYRSGDFASLTRTPEGPVLRDFSGRQPVRFRTLGGGCLNNIDVTHVLRPLALTQYGVHQHVDGSVRLRLTRADMALARKATELLCTLFEDQRITVDEIALDDKILQYSSDIPQAIE